MSTDTPLPPAGRPKGWLLVGERGPTLVNLPRGSHVTPNNRDAPQLAPAESLQPDTDEQPRALVTSLWIAAAFLVAAHVIWVAADMPGAQFLNRLMETLNV